MSIFEGIYQIVRDGRSQAVKDKEAREERRETLERERLFAEYKRQCELLVPYAGEYFTCSALYSTSPQSLGLALDYKEKMVFLSTKENMEAMQNRGQKAIEGRTASGQKYWTTDYGLVFGTSPRTFYSFEVIEGIRMPSKQWVEQSLLACEFFSYQHRTLYEFQKDDKHKQAMIDAKALDEERKKADAVVKAERLQALNVEVSPLTIELLGFIDSHDYYADYSDDPSVWKFHNLRQKVFEKAVVPYPALKALFDERAKR